MGRLCSSLCAPARSHRTQTSSKAFTSGVRGPLQSQRFCRTVRVFSSSSRVYQGLSGSDARRIKKMALDPAATLESVGLGERLNNFPAQLSGGEQQRVSIARALAKNPKLLLCDEPTGALDYKTGKQVLALLQRTCRETGRTVIVITHNTALTAMADRIIQVKSGQILSNKVNEHPVPVEQIEW